MRKKYDLPTNEKNLRKSQKGCQNDRMDVPNPQMRIRHQFGLPKPTNEKKVRFTHKWKFFKEISKRVPKWPQGRPKPTNENKVPIWTSQTHKWENPQSSGKSIAPTTRKLDEKSTGETVLVKQPRFCRVPTPPCDWYPRQRYDELFGNPFPHSEVPGGCLTKTK